MEKTYTIDGVQVAKHLFMAVYRALASMAEIESSHHYADRNVISYTKCMVIKAPYYMDLTIY